MTVFVILVNYHSSKDTMECIESILKSGYTDFKTIIIDNSQTQEPFQEILDWALGKTSVQTQLPHLVYPVSQKPYFVDSFIERQQEIKVLKSKITLIKAEGNNGFSAANNIGIKLALNTESDGYIWILNNDTVVTPNAMRNLVEFLKQHKHRKIGMVGCKVMEYDNPTILQSAGGGKLFRPLAYSKLVGAGQIDAGQFNVENLPLDFVAGTSIFAPFGFVKEVGLLDEDYFLYCEESDWAVRAKKFGWHLAYEFRSLVYHKGGASTGGKGYSSGPKSSTIFSDFYFQRAKIVFTLKHFPVYLPTVYLSFFIVIFNRLRRRQFNRIGLMFRIMANPWSQYRQKKTIPKNA